MCILIDRLFYATAYIEKNVLLKCLKLNSSNNIYIQYFNRTSSEWYRAVHESLNSHDNNTNNNNTRNNNITRNDDVDNNHRAVNYNSAATDDNGRTTWVMYPIELFWSFLKHWQFFIDKLMETVYNTKSECFSSPGICWWS